ncbi:DNA methyltransferase, partial [Helicobacter pylori]
MGLFGVKHPTQKSLALMEKIISIHTNPNDIVLDPFMG